MNYRRQDAGCGGGTEDDEDVGYSDGCEEGKGAGEAGAWVVGVQGKKECGERVVAAKAGGLRTVAGG